MTDTNQLPEPELGYIQTDKSNQPAFSARQMREAMERATQAEVTDGIRPEDFTVDVVVKSMGGFAQINTKGVRVTHKPTGISVTCDVARSQHANRNQAIETLRAILATRPAAVPMTDDEATAMIRETVRGNAIRRGGSTSLQIVRATEAYYGITAQAKKETP